jgi:hypothetical protein
MEELLARNPRSWDAVAYESSVARRAVEALDLESLVSGQGQAAATLEDLRNAAQLKRSDVAARLAAALGLKGRESKVHEYLHRAENGEIPPDRPQPRLFDGLAGVLSTTADAVRAAFARGPGDATSGSAEVFARAVPATASPDLSEVAGKPSPGSGGEEWDEVDRLFLGDGE